MKILHALALLLAVAGLDACGGGGIRSVSAQAPSFSNASLSGTYGFAAAGTIGTTAPYNLAGTIAADGNGEFSGEVAETYPGVGTCHAGLTGKYSIDGTGSGTGSLVLSLSAINGGECRASSILSSVLLALEVGQTGASFVFSESDGNGALAGTALKQ